ncbi:zinc finger protein 93-like [Armigeres subalbatus]|uniref:zinc finger protein 93-like n=1 Tax=Armigeres subalbatus TaxID=124917 RepID=UPI002ED00812
MVIACVVKTCRNHNKNCDLSFYTFPTQRKQGSTKELEKLISMRLAMWRKASGFSRPMNRSVRICGDHFVSGKPAKLEEPGSIDWVPSLHLPDQPSSMIRGADLEYLTKTEVTEVDFDLRTICSIKKCPSNKNPSWKVKIYPFPRLDSSNYVARVLSEKRLLLWCRMLDTSSRWDKIDLSKLQLCSLHFTSGTMAGLTDVENVDWIPTLNMNRQTRFTDHIAYFDLYNLISLVKDSGVTESSLATELVLQSQQSVIPTLQSANVGETVVTPDTPSSLPKVSVGLKCILCLSPTALKPMNAENKKAVELIFKDTLRVDSELICAMCNKSVGEFSAFYEKVRKSQEKAATVKLKPLVKIEKTISNPLKRSAPAPLPSAPDEKRIHSTDEKRVKLFNVLVSNEFQCKLCYVTLATRPGLNDHLFHAHKVKINCKLCKNSFAPEGYASHKAGCKAQAKAKRQAQQTAGTTITATPIKPKAPGTKVSKQKHSCYICKEFFTPGEIIDHVKTHGIDTVPMKDTMIDYEACKQCHKAVQKQNMKRHMEAHESHRNQMRKLIKEQEDKQRFQCSVCLLEFRTILLMEKHKEKHKLVTMDDRIECPDCNKVMTARYFKYHVMVMHDNEQLPCDKCGKLFSRFALKNHRATTCSDDEQVSCSHCGKTMRAHLLKGHVSKVHSTVTAKCRFCPKEYTSREYAISHERWSHRKEWEEKKREGVKQLELDRDQLEEALGIKPNPNEEDISATCPVCLNVHGTKPYIEAHVRKAHSSEYLSMIMNGIIVSTGDNNTEDFDAAEYISEVMGSTKTEAGAM